MNRTFLYTVIDEEILTEFGIHNAYEKYCGNLKLEDVFTTDSVYLAAKQCSSGFMHRADTFSFMSSVWLNSRRLCDEVLSGSFKPRYYRTRLITERGKIREIRPPCFECKVVQKVLCDALLRPALEYRMISTNYASIRKRGTQKLYKDVLKALNLAGKRYKDPVVVMTDFRNFFGSIDNEKLTADVYARYLKDERIVRLLRSFSPEPFGLSLGNECSQVPASFYPSSVDHWIKDRMRVRFYFRYMDDILFISEKTDADGILQAVIQQSTKLGLTIPDEKIRIVPYGENFVYCKERFIFNGTAYYRMINLDIPRRETVKLKKFERKLEGKEMELKDVQNQYLGVAGSIRSHPNTKRIAERLDARYQKIKSKFTDANGG